MPTLTTDTLVKPDMKAVLARTHIATDLHGFLLPVFEAISNAMDGIQTRFQDEAQVKGRIHIKFTDTNDPAKIMISVTDNGVGLTDDNYKSFRTPFSGHKLSEKGRGFGRFIAFKVFARILYSSRHELFTTEFTRTYRFDINRDEELIYFDGTPDFGGTGLCVDFDQPLRDWYDLIRALQPSEISDEVGGHFLPYFLYRWLPQITIQFDDNPPENITSHFKDVFVKYDSGTFECQIDGANETLSYSLARIPRNRVFRNHCLLLAAADRIVGFPRDLSNKIGEASFADEAGQRYIIIAVVRGEAFENRLNDSRTSINLASGVIEDIVSAVGDAIQTKEAGQIAKIKGTQSVELGGALRENPILRIGLRGKRVDEYVSNKPNNWKAEQFISDLAIERYRASTDLARQITAAANNPEDYQQKLKDLVSKVEQGEGSSC